MLKKLLLSEVFILILILLNSFIIFLSGFSYFENNKFIQVADNFITFIFILEILYKFREFGITYFQNLWNKIDIVLIALSIPTFLAFIFNIEIIDYSYLLVFRVLRVFKSFRFLKFIPGIDHLIKGVQRATKASIVVLFGFFIYIFIIGIFSFYLFKETSPEFYENPLKSLYSTFKIFTIEGWFEIPEQVTQNLDPIPTFFTHLFYIFIVLSGGIFGLSLVNSIFVDAMVSDNNDDLERKIDELEKKIDLLLKKHN
jgi:voltage-gated sodium channel